MQTQVFHDRHQPSKISLNVGGGMSETPNRFLEQLGTCRPAEPQLGIRRRCGHADRTHHAPAQRDRRAVAVVLPSRHHPGRDRTAHQEDRHDPADGLRPIRWVGQDQCVIEQDSANSHRAAKASTNSAKVSLMGITDG